MPGSRPPETRHHQGMMTDHFFMLPPARAGFSLIELLVALSLLSLVVTGGFFFFNSVQTGYLIEAGKANTVRQASASPTGRIPRMRPKPRQGSCLACKATSPPLRRPQNRPVPIAGSPGHGAGSAHTTGVVSAATVAVMPPATPIRRLAPMASTIQKTHRRRGSGTGLPGLKGNGIHPRPATRIMMAGLAGGFISATGRRAISRFSTRLIRGVKPYLKVSRTGPVISPMTGYRLAGCRPRITCKPTLKEHGTMTPAMIRLMVT